MENIILWLQLAFVTVCPVAKDQNTGGQRDMDALVDKTLDSLNTALTARPVAGASRSGNNHFEPETLNFEL
jgi:hypothetical protein